jgi:6-methylsalicylate decarboxylase
MSGITMSRGRFLAAGSATLAAGALGLARSAGAAALPATGRRIDIHSHAITASLEAVLRDRGSRRFDGRDLPAWTVDRALAFQAQQRIDLQLLSTPDPAMALAPPATHRSLARALNTELASVARSRPGKFGVLAVLPLQAGPTAALAELSYALDQLKVDGVILPTNVDGKYLGDGAFSSVLSALSGRRTPVLVHPASPRPQDWPASQGSPADTLEYAFESVRCAASLLYAGAAIRYPTLRMIFAGGGGGLPFLSSRVAIADQALQADLFIRPLRAYLYDTAQATSPGALASLQAFVGGPKQIMFGSDWPMVPRPVPLDEVLARVSADVRPLVAGDAAMAVFPTLAARLRV